MATNYNEPINYNAPINYNGETEPVPPVPVIVHGGRSPTRRPYILPDLDIPIEDILRQRRRRRQLQDDEDFIITQT